MNIIDCKGLTCPMPVIKTKKYFDLEDSKETLVIVDNEVAKNNILRLAKGLKLNSSFEEENGLYTIQLSKGEFTKINQEVYQEEIVNKTVAPTILVSSNLLGNGDDRLGETLMKVYINTLAEAEVLPESLMFINGGVKLTCSGSDVLDSLNSMREKGVNIISCGACLDFYNLKEELKVGEIGNMYQIIDLMNKSGNTIKL
ncbi:sulfurtransferase-like selenium metabolism protein YedF [Clostridium tertium]|jgi:selenium metabolism protein YedF|uniref:sulfurtransferase-like selenium metabolism protein YedF n=1 Tax=Clostridium TaxID=1485 RepID=UPI00115C337A|nr:MULTISPECIES: sulfurtransferase-like selenium metabolism protein YedF [Clostridium]MBS5884198.1 sulfurtransferase-like selenium metabolism protein YedF [Clostridium sp.]MDB1924195.1 sulfurtransferase-like selenium metabolism protein YedF [Clostridium tertium]MDB1927270.1 sulfurtransferase-like selenium metabolism protein YedF [Clostridium tertium]MDB1929299.1 sulfurtransferase-like selenium metabolism protein YedF [Clostridium tertium]MDB1945485.1 sulfurtransferase-like selenium metabolism 